MYIYMCVYMYTHVHVHVCIYMHMYIQCTCVHVLIQYTRNELASLAHSFHTCFKHQLIHLTIVLLRYIYTLVHSSKLCGHLFNVIRYTVRCGAAPPAQLHQQRERACAHP